jgi:uncharacterized radical SAM superfamily protein
MGNFRYKLKELEIGDVDVRDGKKSTLTDIDPETGALTWDITDVPAFDTTFSKFAQARDFLKKLAADKSNDSKFRDIYKKVTNTFNDFRTHLRNNYPEEYAKVKNIAEALEKELKEMSSIGSNSGFISGGEGENHNGPSPRKSTYGAYTQAGFKRVAEGPGATFGPGPSAGPEGVKDNIYVKDFKYKLVDKKKLNKAAKGIIVKPLWETDTDVEDYLTGLNITDPDKKKFVASRLLGFDELERKLNELIPFLQQAKHETMDYYRENPDSFAVLYGTDLANDYVNDLIELFKK